MNAILKRKASTTLEQLAELEAVLESLPLSTDEYGCARNHLHNARHYFQQDEAGAGSFELKLLQAVLKLR